MKPFTLEHIEITTEDHLALPGLFFTPTTPTKTAVLYLHGNGGSSIFYKPELLDLFAQSLTSQGIAFLPFNNRGAHFLKQFSWFDGTEKKRRFIGASNELIQECVLDINAAITWLQEQGYETFYLYGHSTGANKVCVYHHYQPKNLNPFAGYILSAGGDDTGIWYQTLGKSAFLLRLENSRRAVKEGRGEELHSSKLSTELLTHQSFVDMADPDGDYNCFPFLEFSGQAELSTLPLFRYFQEIDLPTLTIYGKQDIFCVVPPDEAVKILQHVHPHPELLTSAIIAQADHSFYPQESELVQQVTTWLITQKQ